MTESGLSAAVNVTIFKELSSGGEGVGDRELVAPAAMRWSAGFERTNGESHNLAETGPDDHSMRCHGGSERRVSRWSSTAWMPCRVTAVWTIR